VAAACSTPARQHTQASAHCFYALQLATVRSPLQTWRRSAEGGC